MLGLLASLRGYHRQGSLAYLSMVLSFAATHAGPSLLCGMGYLLARISISVRPRGVVAFFPLGYSILTLNIIKFYFKSKLKL